MAFDLFTECMNGLSTRYQNGASNKGVIKTTEKLLQSSK